MPISLSLALVVIAVVVWIVVMIRRPQPFTPEISDVFVLLVLAFYFRT